MLVWCVSAAARPTAAAALSAWEHAKRLHEALEAKPEQQRTRSEYDRVLDGYRAIYHGDPASPRADASISAVAGLLAEEGRIFQDTKSLNDAIAQYEFLRRGYPGSLYRFAGMIAEGEIYLGGLGDRESAKAVFQNFLKLYPQNGLAGEALQELATIRTEELAEQRAAGHKRSRKPSLSVAAPPPEVTTRPAPGRTADSGGSSPANEMRSLAGHRSQAARPEAAVAARAPSAKASESIAGETTGVNETSRPAQAPAAFTPAPGDLIRHTALAPPRPSRSAGHPSLVTGIRHWSTPVYTRVAIDLDGEVQYEATRVPDPDRIFFDLHGARLSPELIGKSVQVIDDGFLKRIRVAQYPGGVARIVLDVSDVSDYSAFMLPNPYRLIIDIHGSKSPRTALPTQQMGASNPPAARPAPAIPQYAANQRPPAQSSANPGSASQGTANQAPAARPRPSQYSAGSNPQPATPAASTQDIASQDVAALGQQPNRVKATRRPTTAPIAASVAGTTPAPQASDGSAIAAAVHQTSRQQTARQQNPARISPQASSTSATPDVSHSSRGSRSYAPDQGPAIHEAEPTADGGRSLSRALGLKIGRIVVDAGHGGHDSGTLGPGGIEEKDVVLDVALRLGKLLKQRLGADVIFTRDDNTFIPLETRTAIANKAQADLFISVHANSSPDPDARGVETYYLSFTSSADALEVAARENAVSDQSIHQLADLVKKIAMQDKIDESREYAADVEQSLYAGLGGLPENSTLRDRGVKKAPFVVLIGANMPSILAEISFLTNPEDAAQLRDPAYRQRIAQSLYNGVARYVSGLSGVRLAEKGDAGHK
jgi:N-acetylmuramoyl-L-alanine amidase